MKREKTDEYFYSDIVSVATTIEVFTEARGTDQLISGGIQAAVNLSANPTPFGIMFGWLKSLFVKQVKGILTGLEAKKTDYFMSFTLTTTASTSIGATFSEAGTVKKSIDGMRNLVRSKKEELKTIHTSLERLRSNA
jgi:hypothetical protein